VQFALPKHISSVKLHCRPRYTY